MCRYRYRAKGGRFDEDPIEDEYAYDSRHNRASTDDHDHDESGGAKGKPVSIFFSFLIVFVLFVVVSYDSVLKELCTGGEHEASHQRPRPL